MSETKQYKCVNCGEASGALYRTYGPSVLKLNKCESCKGMVDKYIEYDPVIVMIDLVLMSREAQRHVIYNTNFKSYWKLFIILMLLETYGVWRNDSLFNIAVNALCDIRTNATINSTHLTLPVNISMPDMWREQCDGWVPEQRDDDSDLFIWEKDFYIQFISTFTGIIIFIFTIHGMMTLMRLFSKQNEVTLRRVVKAYSLGNMSTLFTLPMLVWGTADTEAATRAGHYLLVCGYSFVVFFNVFTVVYEGGALPTALALCAGYGGKCAATFQVTPRLRAFVT